MNPWVRKIPWRRAWQPTPGFLPQESHGQEYMLSTVQGVTRSQAMTEATKQHARMSLSTPKTFMIVPTCWIQFSSVQSLSNVQFFATPWTAAHQSSLSITNSPSLFELMSIDPVMLSNHLTLCCPLLLPPLILPSIRVFLSQFFSSGGQSIGVSASTSILLVNNQG